MIDFEEVKRHQLQYRRAISAKRIPLDLDELLTVAEERRNARQVVDDLRRDRNQITALVAAGTDRAENIERGRAVNEKLKVEEATLLELENKYRLLAALVPGLPTAEVPEGETDADNVEIRKFGVPRTFDFEFRDQLELAALHKMTNLDGARDCRFARICADGNRCAARNCRLAIRARPCSEERIHAGSATTTGE